MSDVVIAVMLAPFYPMMDTRSLVKVLGMMKAN